MNLWFSRFAAKEQKAPSLKSLCLVSHSLVTFAFVARFGCGLLVVVLKNKVHLK